jgi:hypothetical protein
MLFSSPSSFRKHTEQEIASALKSYALLLDTSFAMHEAFERFLNKYRDDLRGNHLLFSTVVFGELQNRAANPKVTNLEAQAQAKQALQLIEQAQKDGLLEVRGDEISKNEPKTKGAADHEIFRVVTMHHRTRDILVLTLDKKLTQQLRSLTEQQNYTAKDLLICCLLKNGRLVERLLKGEYYTSNNTSSVYTPPVSVVEPQSSLQSKADIITPFMFRTTLEKNLDTPLAVREKLVTGKTIFLKNGTKITLGKELARGGEGAVHEINAPNFVCKIYHDAALSDGKRRKVELMQTRKISNPAVCWICDAVYDVNEVFRGFTMPRVPSDAKPLGSTLFIPSEFCKVRSNWNRINSTTLALNIVKIIDHLHRLNILIGDINPQNILFSDENNVYFVDCDSFQVEGFPCPVGTVNFTAPEIQRQDYKKFLRTKDHELFAVANLLFMIFLPGKTPYAHEGGEDGATNIIDGHFPYPLGERKSDRAPKGPWRYCWSHLDRPLKSLFNQSFHRDGRGKGRVTLMEWGTALKKYLDSLNRFGYQGPAMKEGFDLSLMPRNLSRWKGKVNDEVRPPFRTDGKTDLDAELDKLNMQYINEEQFDPVGDDKKNETTTDFFDTFKKLFGFP